MYQPAQTTSAEPKRFTVRYSDGVVEDYGWVYASSGDEVYSLFGEHYPELRIDSITEAGEAVTVPVATSEEALDARDYFEKEKRVRAFYELELAAT